MGDLMQALSIGLSTARYRIRTGDELGVRSVGFVASKIKGFPARIPIGMLSTHVVALKKDNAGARDLQDVFDIGFSLAKRINRIPLARGMQFGYAVMPLIVGNAPDVEALWYAANAPRAHWALFEFPVIVDIAMEKVTFFEGFRARGAIVWPILQELVISHIEPVVDEELRRGSPR